MRSALLPDALCTHNPLVTREINGLALLAVDTSYDEEPIRGGGLKLLTGRWMLDEETDVVSRDRDG